MKRGLIYVLIAVALAGIVGTLMSRDPGYVLVSYDGSTLQTSLWVAVTLMVVTVLSIYYLMQFLKFVARSTGYFQSWREERQRSRWSNLTGKGLTLLQEGSFERAEKFLVSGVGTALNPAVNYIYAAKAADAQGKAEERERYLREALEADSDAGEAVALASGEMAVDRGDWRAAIEYLDQANQNDVVIRLKSRAFLALRDWQAMLDLMPQLRRVIKDGDELFELQKRVATERLSAPGTTDDSLAIIYKKLPDAVRNDKDVLYLYCSSISSEKDAEVAIRGALKQNWNPELVTLYGSLGSQDAGKRLKTAQGWLKSHADDAALHLCLGILFEATGDKENARNAYQKSVDLNNTSAASANLGRLFAFDGDYKKSSEYLIQAIKLPS